MSTFWQQCVNDVIPFVLCVCVCSYSLPEPSVEEQALLDERRGEKSMFVQELLLSTLAYSDSSSSNSEDSDHEQT